MTQTAAATNAEAGPTTAKWQGLTLSVVRVVISFLFLCHGLQKMGFFDKPAVPVGTWPGWYAGVIELVGSVLLLLGLFTRPVAVLLSGTMAYAYFAVHQPDALLPLQNKGETAALYSWIFLLFAVVGPGIYALDTLLRRRRS
ncbi:DoxX family protein [Amycolatopsis regifaucium]|uniref:DoxX family protein n=1 Tax=Amycolatopsis regifaucium TaxID=546365 RepID=A0A154MH41_9PSEU|nr:DoxX family protein [Amycolatopsis regifaucium]KZB83798.1 DoxX family protein [Amycolatopsis regifaucium]OKA06761.1 DoxX family protein [Amycolatopsis regifaucium]SFH26185.1 putative oxidoreductase [Amycolatopsis regifaucium]